MNFKNYTKSSLICAGLAICFALSSQTLFSQSILKVRVASSTDDAEEKPTGTAGDLTSSDLEFVMDKTSNQTLGLRFTDIKLPKGALISKAYIQFTVDEITNIDPCNLVIKAENVDNSTTFTTAVGTISTRPTTTESVNWNPTAAWTLVGLASDDQKTSDLKTLVQALVNRAGWASGNAISFIITGTGARVAQAYDLDPAKAPELVIEYYIPITAQFAIKSSSDDAEEKPTGTAGDLTSSDLELVMDKTSNQTIGLRYANVSLPKGAIINNAYIQFAVDEVTNVDPCNLVIKAEDTDNSSTFTIADGTISKRTSTSQSVNWNPTAKWEVDGLAGMDQRTPDLKLLVQSIINKISWNSGNAMSFIITGSGSRVAQAYDRDPSKAAILVVEYMGLDNQVKPVAEVGNFPINRNSQWKYNDKGVNLDGMQWNAKTYADDANWDFGNGKLGYGITALGTPLKYGSDANSKFPTTYLRRTIDAKDVSKYESLIVYTLADDGFVMYINGQEVLRKNVASPSTYNTLATTDVTGADESKYVRNVIPNTLLNNEINTIAVEIHQSSLSSSDLVFDMQMIGKLPYPAISSFPIKKGSNWLYNDQGTDLGTQWIQKDFVDTEWANGTGSLGYTDPVSTVVSFGDDNNNKYPTAYFRKKFIIADLSKLTGNVLLNIMKDDGAVVYINGVEIKRTNMPTGTISYSTFALASAAEGVFESYEIPKSALLQGDNIIAVEVHQNEANSSDMVFELELFNKPEKPVLASGCNGPNDTHISCFTSVAPSTKGQLLVIPENSHIIQLLVQDGTPYTVGGGNVGTNFDFTGFIPENMTSSVKGKIALNHETTPGAVSMFDVSFDLANKLWKIDASRGIDFSGVVGTARNCSGGITPWGTSITAEEVRGTTDSNTDGYVDMGWLVEIDPKTSKVAEYGTGKPQKLWAMGNGSHENVVIASDEVTAYWGEDAADGSVYKYVADKKGDLSAGKLYVLNLGSQLLNDEPQSATGVWTLVPNSTQAERNTSYTLAKSLGSTLFKGVEDVEIGTVDNKIYFASKGNSRVYRFKDNGTTISEFETFIGGKDYSFMTDETTEIKEAWGTGNDNLTFDDRGNLYVLQDGSQDHIWLVRPNHTQDNPKVELFATTPAGSEPTGMTFSPDYKFMFVSMQNPSTTNTATTVDASGKTITFNKSSLMVIAHKSNIGTKSLSVGDYEVKHSNTFVYPNPTAGKLNVTFVTDSDGNAKVEVFDLLGKKVATPVDANFAAGRHTVSFQMETKGLYLVKATTTSGVNTYKVIAE